MSNQSGKGLINILLVIGVVGIIANVVLSPKEENIEPPKKDNYTQSEMKGICKSYIGQHFSKPENIIKSKYIKEDAGVHFISASYIRSSDNSKWEYVCSITGNNIIWASIRDDGSIGRWRHEDELEIINGKVKVY